MSMDPDGGTVKKRRYDSSRRREQARRTRGKIEATATRLFLAHGYGGTTIASIAEEVGVSVDTIYKAYGGKAGLVRALFDRALAGEGPVHAETRSDHLQTTESDPRVIVRGFGRLTAEVAPRAGPIVLLVRDAAVVDPDLGELMDQFARVRMERMTHNADNLARAGHLRPDLSIEDAAEIMWIYSSPELYELLVMKLGWSPDRLGDFVARALEALLLPPP